MILDGSIYIGTEIETKRASQQLATLENKMNRTAERINALKAKLNELGEQQIQTDEFAEVQKQIEEAEAKLNALTERMEKWKALGKSEDSMTFKSMQYDADQLAKTLTYAKAERDDLIQSGKAYIAPESSSQYKEMVEQIRQGEAELSKMAKQHVKLERLQRRLSSTVQKAYRSMSDAIKDGGRSIGGLLSRIIRLAKGVFIFRLLTQAFRSMLNGFKDGLKNFARYSSEYNAVMSAFTSASAQLKNALAVIAAPILNIALPAVTAFINGVTRATEAVSRFIAAITGKSTWTRAKKQQIDYAKSLDGTAASAKKAENALAKFDDLDVLQQDTGSSGGAGGGELTGADAFEEVPLGKNLAASILEAWNNADLTAIGGIVGEKLKQALDTINWQGIKSSSRRIAKRIATFLNGFLETEGLDKSVGHTVGEAVNTGLEFAGSWLENFHFDSLGKFVTSGLQECFKTLDWKQATKNLSLGAVAILDTIRGAISGIDWEELPDDICNAIGDALEGIQWDQVFESAGELLGTAFGAALDLGGAIGSKLDNALEEFKGWLWDHAFEDGKFTIEGLLQGIEEELSDIGSWIWDHIFSPFIEGFKTAFGINSPSVVMKQMGQFIIEGLIVGLQDGPDKVKETFERIRQKVVDVLKNITLYVAGRFMEGWRAAWRGIATFTVGIVNTVISAFESLINRCIDGINAMIKAAVDLANKIPGFDFDAPKIEHVKFGRVSVPELANGGITTGSTLARIGEAGREVVLPLENNLSYLDEFARRIADKIPAAQNGPVYLQVDGKTFARLMHPYSAEESKRIGVGFSV